MPKLTNFSPKNKNNQKLIQENNKVKRVSLQYHIEN